jgi:hypothetical protein
MNLDCALGLFGPASDYSLSAIDSFVHALMTLEGHPSAAIDSHLIPYLQGQACSIVSHFFIHSSTNPQSPQREHGGVSPRSSSGRPSTA